MPGDMRAVELLWVLQRRQVRDGHEHVCVRIGRRVMLSLRIWPELYVGVVCVADLRTVDLRRVL